MKQICSLFTVLLLLFTIPSSLAAKSTPTPAPVEIDTEVIESVRKAALKTDFNTDFDAPQAAEGTITYTFKKK